MKAFRNVAKQLVDKYPITFRDIDNDGVVMGDGTHSIVCKLSDRNNYLNRPHKRSNSDKTDTATKFLKKKLNSSAGCVQWNPADHGNSSEDKIKKINEMDTDDDDFFSLLDDTYVAQRLFLNDLENPPTVQEVQNKWPVLLQKSAIIWHFKKLTNISLELLEQSFESKAEKIVKYAIIKKILNEDSLEDVNKSCIEFYAKHFKEDISNLIYKMKAQSDQPISEIVRILSPCLLQDSNNQYSVIFEKIEILKSVTFMEGFSLMFALYFIFNLEYPSKIGATLEMVQRYHIKIHPASGGKSKKTKNKVLNLMKKIDV
ncbi:hypothetical protein JTB14_003217 [Gonioctena quinquepunctata]|nr:hypothetical protein JTB14_003217 [Gonioctena quinquepunctata]